MGTYSANVARTMFQENKKFVGGVFQQGVGKKPLVADDLNDIDDIHFFLNKRLAEATLGTGFTGTAFKIIVSSNANDFNITGGDGSDDGAARGYIGGYPVSKYSTSNFLSDTNHDTRSKSTALTSTILTDSAANYTINELVNRTLYPNVNINTGFVITANTATTITTAGNLLSVASVGNKYKIGLTTPSAARTDTVVLDVYVDQVTSSQDPHLLHHLPRASGTASIESAIRKKIEQHLYVKEDYSSTPSSSHIDLDGNRHYVTRLATFSRTSGTAIISSSSITDVRNIDYSTIDRTFNNLTAVTKLTSETLFEASGTIYASGTFAYSHGDRSFLFSALTDSFIVGGFNLTAVTAKGNMLLQPGSGDTYNDSSKYMQVNGISRFVGKYDPVVRIQQQSSGTQNALLVQDYSGNSATWLDNLGRLTTQRDLHARQLIVHPSGSSQQNIISYDYASGIQTFVVRSDGQARIVPINGLSVPAFDVVLNNMFNTSTECVRLKGDVTTADSLFKIENSSTGASTPVLLQVSTNTTGLSDILAEIENLNNNSYFRISSDGKISDKFQTASGTQLILYDNSDTARFSYNANGTLQLVPFSTGVTSLYVTDTSAVDIIKLMETGEIIVTDDGADVPGLLVKTSGGTNRVRVNVRGLNLSSAEITQDAVSPTDLNILSNDGIVLDYDENNNGVGSMTINAGSDVIAVFGNKASKALTVYNSFICGGIISGTQIELGGSINVGGNLNITGNIRASAETTNYLDFLSASIRTIINSDIQLKVADESVIVGNGSSSANFSVARSKSSQTSPSDGLATIENSNSVNSSAHASLMLKTGGVNAGDPFVSFKIGSEPGWSIGTDNSTGDRFKIGNNWDGVGSNQHIVLGVTGVTPLIGINQDSPAYTLDIGANVGSDTSIRLEPNDQTAIAPGVGTGVGVTFRGSKIVFCYNDGGTARYKYLDLSGTGVTWVHTTTAP